MSGELLPSSQMGFEHADAGSDDDTCADRTASHENGDESNGGAASVDGKDASNSCDSLDCASTTTSSAPTLTTSKASTAMAATMATILVACINERSLQKSLTVPPLVYGQAVTEARSKSMPDVVQRMQRMQQGRQPSKQQTKTTTSSAADATAASGSSTCILNRPIKPRIFLGTRSSLASIHSYLAPGPGPSDSSTRTTEWVRMPRDGTTILLEWEFARLDANSIPLTPHALSRPVVLILHGLNNHAGYGYIRSMMRTCTQKGWIAVAMNFRGCESQRSHETRQPNSNASSGFVPSPRGYNGAFTGDIRSVVHILSGRLQHYNMPLFIVGNSLGANLLVKYLGEEGYSGTLPHCVAGAVTMANPMRIDSRRMNPYLSAVVTVGAKATLWTMSQLTRSNLQQPRIESNHFKSCIDRAWLAVTLADYDAALAPMILRNETTYPFAHSIGYHRGAWPANSTGTATVAPATDRPSRGNPVTPQEEYWKESSSLRYARHVTIPLLQLVARDDFLAHGPFMGSMAYNVSNPHIVVVETFVGGHLGWQQEASKTSSTPSPCWADDAMAEYIQAILDTSHRVGEATEDKSASKPAAMNRAPVANGTRSREQIRGHDGESHYRGKANDRGKDTVSVPMLHSRL